MCIDGIARIGISKRGIVAGYEVRSKLKKSTRGKVSELTAGRCQGMTLLRGCRVDKPGP